MAKLMVAGSFQKFPIGTVAQYSLQVQLSGGAPSAAVPVPAPDVGATSFSIPLTLDAGDYVATLSTTDQNGVTLAPDVSVSFSIAAAGTVDVLIPTSMSFSA